MGCAPISAFESTRFGGLFDSPAVQEEIARLEAQTADPGFWSDPAVARHTLERLEERRAPLERIHTVDARLKNLETLLLLGQEAPGDAELLEEASLEAPACERAVESLEMGLLLTGPYDKGDAILAIHPGAGGTESQDWAEMLLRMYRRWTERSGFRAEILDLLEGDEAGIKSATLSVQGPNAYGLLHAEKGVHRLVRISPFDAAARRHTSFASVDVLPNLPDDGAEGVEIRPEDLEMDTYRSSGAGGQHVNKTESAVRITHKPTGIVVTCQNERSQYSNRDTAMRILRAKLAERAAEERERELAAVRGKVGDIAFGNQIRSYVLHPYSLVKDHRTGAEVGDVQGVMDGEIDPFITAFLLRKRQEAVAAGSDA